MALLAVVAESGVGEGGPRRLTWGKFQPLFPKETPMTRHDHRNGLDQVAQHIPTPEGDWQEMLELLAEHGFEGMARVLETLFNEAMKLERSAVLDAQPYERTPRRRGYANGFKPKTVRTRVGKLELALPQTRVVPFHLPVLDRRQRTQRAFKLSAADL